MSTRTPRGISIEEIRLLPEDARIKRLELKPAAERRADDVIGLLRRLLRDELQRLVGPRRGGLRQKLHLTGPVHRYEPPGRLVDGLADGQQSVVLQDSRLA